MSIITSFYCQQIKDSIAVQEKNTAIFNKKDIIHDNARLYAAFGSSPKNYRTTLGNSVTSTTFPGLSTLRLSLVFVITFFEGQKNQNDNGIGIQIPLTLARSN